MPLHPAVVHLPIALTFILPFMIMVFALFLKKNKMVPAAWLIVVGLQLGVTAFGYVALETGENDEDAVSKVLAKDLIHKHEEAAEIFVGSTVIALVLSIAVFFIRKELQFLIHLGIFALSLVSCFLAYRTGTLGGELVYVHGAADAHLKASSAGLLPTPGLNTSESPYPEDSESLKTDDHDYGGDEELSEEEEFKQED